MLDVGKHFKLDKNHWSLSQERIHFDTFATFDSCVRIPLFGPANFLLLFMCVCRTRHPCDAHPRVMYAISRTEKISQRRPSIEIQFSQERQLRK